MLTQFEIRNSHGGSVLVSVWQDDRNVSLRIKGRRSDDPVTIAPSEARELADALMRYADRAEAVPGA